MKNVFDIAIDTMAAAHRQNNPPEPEDYRDEEGLLCCGKCHTRKEGVYDFGEHGKKVLPFLCKCQTEERDRREAEEKQRKFREECERRPKGRGSPIRHIWSRPSTRTTAGTRRRLKSV